MEYHDSSFEGYKNKLVDRLYGVLCEKEKDGEWEKFLDTIIVEIYGIGANTINFWTLIGKLNMLHFLNYKFFRKTIFECMNLVSGLEVKDELH